ncbi:MAG TPA: VPDSG-CTERM sorting domain-containing protein [Lacunisphaera sp.]|nr:VPDSG-CTERM sorting domain-containing protein [Lacunisphaera sp.]
MNPSSYDDLYWGLAAPVSAGLNGSLNTLTFASATATTATFTGTTLWQDADPFGGLGGTGGMMSVNLQFILTLTGASFVSAGSVGLSPTLGVVADVNGTSFTANLQFLANYGSGWMALNNVEQLGSGRTVSNFSGGFYYTDSVGVPDSGATVGLLGLAGLALVGMRRRAQRA